MSVELGHFILILAFLVALVQAVIPFYGAVRSAPSLMRLGVHAAYLQAGLLSISFLILVSAFIRSDFSVAIVVANSALAKPLIYKIAGTWGNHEGSMLLWALILALYGVVFAVTTGAPEALRARTLAVQGLIGSVFIAFILFTSNPFARLLRAPFEGRGLNPVLQDPALALHPPLLYGGYVGFSVSFAICVAALSMRPFPYQWVRYMRPFMLVAWVFLTLGIALGSFWAYYELGWGGFWFWDPVENASLMPWLTGTALLHTSLVAQRRQVLHRWCLILAILTFGLALAGTFLVRSGVLTSVHAFATDPARGVFILIIMSGFMALAFGTYARAMRDFSPSPALTLLSREGALVFNNLILTTAMATIFIGTIYPLVLDALGFGKISVGPPYFSTVLIPLAVPFVLAVPIAPLLGWRSGEFALVYERLGVAAILALLIGLGVVLSRGGSAILPALAMIGAAWLIFGSLADFFNRVYVDGRVRIRRVSFVVPLAHAGIGVMLLGIIGATAWRSEIAVALAPHEEVMLSGFRFRLDRVSVVDVENYTATRAQVSYWSAGNASGHLFPEQRFYETEKSTTTEAAIDKGLMRHIYVVIGDDLDGKRVVRVWIHPLVAFIWLGAMMMAVSGILSLSVRRG